LADKYILALETSSSICGAAIVRNNDLLSIKEKNVSRKHAELLPDFTKASLNNINMRIDDIDAIAVSIGPGSFTGLRIGLGFAKGIAYAKTLPIIPVPSLLSLAFSLKSYEPKQGISHSHSRKVFYQTFEWVDNIPRVNEKARVVEIDDYIININKGFQYNCENIMDGIQGIETAKPSSAHIGKLGFIYFDDWVVKKPYNLVPNYIAPFEIK
tara:strand:+ start:163 stop:798 length:636 start_codon:yes stop_codon:yes gene_type:complete